MHMRFVRFKVKEGKLWDYARHYEARVIKALQETMEDLYETVFTSSLNDKNNKKWMYKKVSSYS